MTSVPKDANIAVPQPVAQEEEDVPPSKDAEDAEGVEDEGEDACDEADEKEWGDVEKDVINALRESRHQSMFQYYAEGLTESSGTLPEDGSRTKKPRDCRNRGSKTAESINPFKDVFPGSISCPARLISTNLCVCCVHVFEWPAFILCSSCLARIHQIDGAHSVQVRVVHSSLPVAVL